MTALPDREYARVCAQLNEIELTAGMVLLHRDEAASDVWFAASGVASLLTSFADGRAVEIGAVGAEGLIGIHAALDVPVALHDAIVDIPGRGCRMPIEIFREHLRRNETLRHLVDRYLYALVIEIAQTAACNRLHPLRQRASRWLLAVHDRAGVTELPVTQELLAMRLGVRRAGVCEVMQELRTAGAIDHRPGVIVIRDRTVLESTACECYEIERHHFDAVFA